MPDSVPDSVPQMRERRDRQPLLRARLRRAARLCACGSAHGMWRGSKHSTRIVRSAAQTLPDVALRYVEITPYKPGGIIERLPLLSGRSKGSLRSIVCAAPLFWQGPVDVFWTQADTALFPVFSTRARLFNIPWALSTDATTAQVESFPEYGMRTLDGHVSLKHRLRNKVATYCYQHAALLLPWSHWAAEAIIREYAVPAERVHVVPPGVDLRLWPQRAQRAEQAHLPRLLFVGGDFERKGGPLLLDVFRAHFRGRCELHLVTKGDVAPEDGVFVYSDLGPNDRASAPSVPNLRRASPADAGGLLLAGVNRSYGGGFACHHLRGWRDSRDCRG